MPFRVDFEELHPYPRSVWQEGIFLGTRQLKCAWADRVTLLVDLDDPTNSAWPYPDGPSDARLFKVQTDSLGKQTNAAGTTAEYAHAILTCWYHNQGPLLYGQKDLYTETLTGHYSAEQVPFEDLRWLDGDGGMPPAKLDERPPLSITSLAYQVIVHQATTISPWVYRNIRRVNPGVFAPFHLPITFPPQTMLYTPATVQTTTKTSGLRVWDIVARWLIHASWADYDPTTHPTVGWNTYWRVETMQFEPLYLSNGTRYMQYPVWTTAPFS